MSQTVFRLKTAVQMLGVADPLVIVPDIAEPIKWDAVRFTMSVPDEKMHGLSSDYGNGELKLQFNCENAHELIVSQYRQYGTDAIVELLVVDIDREGKEFVDYNGKLDFETINIEAGRVDVSIVRHTIEEKAKNRFETPIALDMRYTLDNQYIVQPNAFELPLPGQTIRETGEISKRFPLSEPKEFAKPGVGGRFNILPNLLWPTEKNPVPAEAVALQQMEGFHQLSGGVMPDGSGDFPLIDATVAGSYSLEVDWLTKISLGIHRQNAILEFGRVKFARWIIAPMVVVKQPEKEDQIIKLQEPMTGSGETLTTGDQMVKVRYTGDFELPKGSKVYLHIQTTALTTKSLEALTFSVNTTFIRVKVDRKTRAEASITTAYSLPDALRFVMGAVTSVLHDDTGMGDIHGSLIDRANPLQPLDGPATEYAVASGGQLRGLTKAPTFTLKELVETLWAHHAAGWLFERDDKTGKESIRIEPGEWFYRGDEILKIDDVFEYGEDPNKDLLFNKLEVGYKKFPDEGPGVTEEFNTVRTYQTPLVSREATQEILCPLIGAGTAIEAARRLGLTKTDASGKVVPTTDAGKYDDDNFILHLATQSDKETVQFIIQPPQKFPGKPFATYYVQFSGGFISKLFGGKTLKNDDVITFTGTGTANDGVPMTIISLSKPKGLLGFGSLLPTYYVTAPTFVATPGPVVVEMRNTNQPGKLRGDERLEVTGVTDPSNTVNLELSPGRMLRKHAVFINSGLYYKQAIDEIRCTAYKQNGNLVTQARSESNPLPGDRDKQRLNDTGDIALGSLERFDKLFVPDLITAKVRLTKQQVRLIREALSNKSDDEAINMGFLSILNPDGNYSSGYVQSLSFDAASEVADIVLKKKAVRNPDRPDCGDYRDWTIGRFETDKSADPNLYRFCRFSDFA